MSDYEGPVNWAHLQSLINAGDPATVPAREGSGIEFFVEAGGARIGLLAPVTKVDLERPLSGALMRFADIRVRFVDHRQKPHLELSTAASALYREFLSLTDVTIGLISEGHLDPITAVGESLMRWRRLLATRESLAAEERLGLLGELWLLHRLISAGGPSALDAWVGPRGEPHDFRLYHVDLEVKATRSPLRIHLINGLEQLEASNGHPLMIMSLQFAPAGAQTPVYTLAALVNSLAVALVTDGARLEAFNWLLREQIGYRAENNADDEPMVMRQKARLVPVDAQCPALIGPAIRELLGASAPRLVDVRYRVDLTGLGAEDGTSAFLALVPDGSH